MKNFTKAMIFVAKWEGWNFPNGGYVNNPNDPGGETKYGISHKAYPQVKIKDLTRADAQALMYRDYWLPCDCDRLEWPMACAMFDTSINMGLATARRFKEKSEDNWKKFLELRTERYLMLTTVNPKLREFKDGWLRRVNDLKKFIELEQPQL